MLSNHFDSRVESVSCALSAESVPVCLWSGQHDVLIHSLYGLCTSYSLCTAMTSEHSCLDIHHAPLTLSYFWLHLSTGPATCPAIRAQTCEPFLPLWLKTSSWILKMCLFVQYLVRNVNWMMDCTSTESDMSSVMNDSLPSAAYSLSNGRQWFPERTRSRAENITWWNSVMSVATLYKISTYFKVLKVDNLTLLRSHIQSPIPTQPFVFLQAV